MDKNQRKQFAKSVTLDLLEALRNSRIDSMKQKDLAEELGVDNATASRYESGFIDLSIENFVEMCLVLKLDPTQIFTEIYYKNKYKSNGKKL